MTEELWWLQRIEDEREKATAYRTYLLKLHRELIIKLREVEKLLGMENDR